MRLYLKRKLFPWNWHFYVTNKNDDCLLLIDTKMGRTGREMFIYNKNNTNREEYIAHVKENYKNFLPQYTIEIDNKEICKMKYDGKMFNRDYLFEGLPYHLKGTLWTHNYSLYDNDQSVMNLKWSRFSFMGRTYRLNIHNKKDVLLCVCVAAVVAWSEGRAAGWGRA